LRGKHHLTVLLLALALLPACMGTVNDMQRAAQAELQEFIAQRFRQLLADSVYTVVGQLAVPGGFLDNPLVRIMLPPPLGLAVTVARTLQQATREDALEAMLNHAAEDALPVVGPVLVDTILNLDDLTAEELFRAGGTAATDYLREQARAQVLGALVPAVEEKLARSGAVELYGELLEAQAAVEQAAEAVERAAEVAAAVQEVAEVPPDQLDEYVADRAMDGLFKHLAERELEIRDWLASLGPL